MTAHTFFEVVVIALRCIAAASVFAVSAMNIMVSRTRMGSCVALYWVLLGVVFVVLLPMRWNDEVQVFGYLFMTFVAAQSIRRLLGYTDSTQAYASNRKLMNRFLGARLTDRVFARVDRTLARERQARHRGITVVQVMQEEHARRRR